MNMNRVVIIGGGAAGMMAAVWAARGGCDVTLIEKNEKLGKKVFITGKGRCNVTNACDPEELFQNVVTNQKFLYSAFYGFDNFAGMEFFEQLGVPLKTERGNRVFPKSDHASDIINAFSYELRRLGVEILLNSKVTGIETKALSYDSDENTGDKKKNKKQQSEVSAVFYEDLSGKKKRKETDSVILTTGGISYPLTGSTGDGHKMAEKLGHKITKMYPALVPLYTEETWCKDLMGLALKNVTATIKQGKKTLYNGFGEMLFTHYGVSGPLILSASSYITQKCENAGMKLFIDLKPALTHEQLDKRLIREFEQNHNRQFKNAISSLFPTKLIPVMIALSGIHPEKKVNEITKEERKQFGELIKALSLTIVRTSDYKEAIITQGGVSVKEVNPSTMESKLVKGLYFAGELLDLDALTGGFNLQIAWSTAYLAAMSAAENLS